MGEAEAEQYRKLAFAVASEAKRKLSRPVSLDEIYWGIFDWKNGLKQREIVQGVQGRVQDSIAEGFWPFTQFCICKFIVDRCVNEAADPDFCPNNIAMLVCVSPGIYMVNSVLVLEKKPAEVGS